MKKKPILFEAACIFSIVGSGIGILSMLFATLFFRFAIEKITQFTNITATENLSRLYFAWLMAAFCVSFAGAMKLYRMQRVGLYFYLIAQVAILLLPVVWLGSNAFSVSNATFIFLFSGIYLYYSNDKSAIVSR